jgi:hypothetical protein
MYFRPTVCEFYDILICPPKKHRVMEREACCIEDILDRSEPSIVIAWKIRERRYLASRKDHLDECCPLGVIEKHRE